MATKKTAAKAKSAQAKKSNAKAASKKAASAARKTAAGKKKKAATAKATAAKAKVTRKTAATKGKSPKKTASKTKKKTAAKAAKAAPKTAAKVPKKKKAARKTAPKAKSAASKTSTAKKQAVAKKRTSRVQKLLAMKAEKAKKSPHGEAIIKSSRRKRAEPKTEGRFVRRIAAPQSTAQPAASARQSRRKSVLRKRDLEELRKALEAERQRLIAQLAALDESASLKGPSDVNKEVPGYSIHLAEYATDNQVVETTLAQRALQAERLAEIEQALQRINQPGYGICQHCGKPIGLERLKVKPFAAYCVPCRELKERGRL